MEFFPFVRDYITEEIINLKFSLYLIKHHNMKVYKDVEVYVHASLTSAIDGGEWSASRLGCFNPGENLPVIYWIVDWVNSKASHDAAEKRKILYMT
jgi:hypothetical protein